MTDKLLDELFLQRTHFLPFRVGEDDAATGSRVGGAAPAILAGSPPACPVCAGPVQYVLTLAGDVLGASLAQGRAVSILACANYGCLLKSWQLMEPSSLLFHVHEESPRAAPGSPLESEFEGRRLVADAMQEGTPTGDDSTVGGEPGYIQPGTGPVEEQAAKARGAGFLFQWSETSYLNDMQLGTYPFGFGAVYVFAERNPITGLPELSRLMGFWQTS